MANKQVKQPRCKKCGKPVDPNDKMVETDYSDLEGKVPIYSHIEPCTPDELEAERKADAEEYTARKSERDDDFLDPSDN